MELDGIDVLTEAAGGDRAVDVLWAEGLTAVRWLASGTVRVRVVHSGCDDASRRLWRQHTPRKTVIRSTASL
jgi:hypothetical protein